MGLPSTGRETVKSGETWAASPRKVKRRPADVWPGGNGPGAKNAPETGTGATRATDRDGGSQVLRGIISGGVWGILVSALVLAITSLNSEPPPGNRPPLRPAVDTPDLQSGAGALLGGADDAVPGGSQDEGGAPAPSDTPQVGGPGDSPAAIAALPDADTAPPDVPQTGDADRAIAEPSAPRDAPALGGGAADEPISITGAGDAPEAPEEDAAPEADRASAAPVATPDNVGDEVPVLGGDGSGPDAEAGAGTIDLAAPGDDRRAGADAPAAPAAPDDTDAVARPPTTATETAPAPQTGADIARTPEPDPGSDPAVAPGTATAAPPAADSPEIAPPAIDDLPPRAPDDTGPGDTGPGGAVIVELPDATATPDDVVIIEESPDAPGQSDDERSDEEDGGDGDGEDSQRISLVGPDAALPPGSPDVPVLRPDAPTEDEAPEDIAPPDPAAEPEAPALVAHAADWTPDDAGLPRLSVILVDTGTLGPAAVQAVAAIPFPVSVAIDATAPEAKAMISGYRAAGIEVLAIARLPEGATPQDAEVILSAAFDAVPETIALLDPGDGGLQSNRDVTEQAMSVLASSGRGFVTASRGLNTALRIAEAEGVAADVLYRDLDSEGQEARVIRRFLDQAAFRARQQSGVVLLGRVRPDTLSALTLWGSAARSEQVTMAPVSAVLTSP